MTGKIINDIRSGRIPSYLLTDGNKRLTRRIVAIFEKKIKGSDVKGTAVLCVSCPLCEEEKIRLWATKTRKNNGEFILIFPFDFDENRGFESDFGHTVRCGITGFDDLDLFEKNLGQRFNIKSAV